MLSSGAWQRTITPFQAEQVMKDRGWPDRDMLRQLQPEQLPACYGVVWIDPYTDDPHPRFLFWRHDGGWGGLARDAVGIADACASEFASLP